MNIIGEVEGRNAIIVDDMVDTAGTLTEAVRTIREQGALKVFAVTTHAVLSGPAMDRIENSDLQTLLVTDTIPLSERAAASDKVQIATVAELFGEAIMRIHKDLSVSSLFN